MLYRLNVACKNLQKYIYIKKYRHIQHLSKQTEMEKRVEEIKVINEI